MKHANNDVQQAIIRLADALCSWERSTGIESVLIVREKGFVFRAVNGKPIIKTDIVDAQLVEDIGGGG